MDSRERIYCIMNFEEPDRIGFIDFFWPETIDRWRTEGLPRTAFLHEYFGFDIYTYGVDVSPKYDSIVVDETEEWVIVRDSFGVKVKSWRGRSGTPHPIEPAVRTLEEFKERIEPLLDPELPLRVSSSKYPFKGDLEKAIRRLQEKFFVVVSVLGPFEYSRHILGESVDKVLLYMYKDPKMLEYIYDVLGRFISAVAKAFLDIGVDGVWVWDDMAYKNGPFFSPALYRKFVKPAHEKIIQPFRAKKLPAILHCDGNFEKLIPDIIDAGFTAIQPLEAKAGMDVRKLKAEYGDKLCFIGNIDVRALSSSKEDIKKEIESKIPIAMQGGGYIAGSDHSVPPTVSLENYLYFIKAAKKIGTYK